MALTVGQKLTFGGAALILAAGDLYLAGYLARQEKNDHDTQSDPSAPINDTRHGNIKAGVFLSIVSASGLLMTGTALVAAGTLDALKSCGFFAPTVQPKATETTPLNNIQETPRQEMPGPNTRYGSSAA